VSGLEYFFMNGKKWPCEKKNGRERKLLDLAVFCQNCFLFQIFWSLPSQNRLKLFDRDETNIFR